MNNWIIKFQHQISGDVQYREYPVISQWKDRMSLNHFLQKRNFLIDYLPILIHQYNVEEFKQGWGKLFGELIYK